MLSEIDEVGEVTDFVLVSELETLRLLVKTKSKRNPGVLYVLDVGDIREGIWFEQCEDTLAQVKEIAGERWVGVATNLGCFGGVMPDYRNMSILRDIGKSYRLSVISGGNTAALKLIEENRFPEGINHFRIGESVFLGTDVTGNRNVPGTTRDTFILEAEIIELQEKPSVPVGEIGQDAFGRKPVFADIGWRKKAILGIGEQDILANGLRPFDRKTTILHASSDHTILDVTESTVPYRVGGIMRFHLTYGALLRAMTSEYVFKDIVV
jgi:predicted amino acid racemase